MVSHIADIILASSSPRRSDLLSQLGVTFRVVRPEMVEVAHDGERPRAFALRMAVEKAHWVANQLSTRARTLIIAADTVVTLDDHILGKPTDPAHAKAMLRQLSGHTHQVITGMCVLAHGDTAAPDEVGMAVSTDVEMRPLGEAEIARYVASGEPMDKAGAYAIQGGAAHMVCGIRGSYTNVVGLPMAELAELLRDRFDLSPDAGAGV